MLDTVSGNINNAREEGMKMKRLLVALVVLGLWVALTAPAEVT
jgi:hypothetical protein